jgi:hypothetical protein
MLASSILPLLEAPAEDIIIHWLALFGCVGTCNDKNK